MQMTFDIVYQSEENKRKVSGSSKARGSSKASYGGLAVLMRDKMKQGTCYRFS